MNAMLVISVALWNSMWGVMLFHVWYREEINTCHQHVSNPSGYSSAVTFIPKTRTHVAQ